MAALDKTAERRTTGDSATRNDARRKASRVSDAKMTIRVVRLKRRSALSNELAFLIKEEDETLRDRHNSVRLAEVGGKVQSEDLVHMQ